MSDGESPRGYIEKFVEQIALRHQLSQEEKEQLCNLVFDSLSAKVSVPEQREEVFAAVNVMLQRAGYPDRSEESPSATIQSRGADWTNSPTGQGIQEKRRYPRVEVNWPFTIKTPQGPVATVMKDISAGGAYFLGQESFPRDEKFPLSDMHLRSSKLGLSIGAKVIRSSIHYLENEIVSFGIGVRFARLSPEAQRLISTLISGHEKGQILPHGTGLTSAVGEVKKGLQADSQWLALEVEPNSYPQVALFWRKDRGEADLATEILFSRELWISIARACEEVISSIAPSGAIEVQESLSLMAERIMSEVEAEDNRLRYQATYEDFFDSVVEINSRKDMDRVRRGQMIHDMAYQVKLEA